MHWTYEEWDNKSDLYQGDILEPSDYLKNLLKDVHPYFDNEKYIGFLILTQTCDLFRRKESGNRCGATHINLAVIRSLYDIISDSLKDNFGFLSSGIYATQRKKSVENLMERIINQNENKLGLFYLHPDLDSGITVESVAILRVSISVKANEHYESLTNARSGRLSKEFQPKLGWMVGNLFSRVGVTDWKEKSNNLENEIINSILSQNDDKPIWLDKTIYMKIIKNNPDFDSLSKEKQQNLIKEYNPPPPLKAILELIGKTLENILPRKVSEKHLDKVIGRLKNDPRLAAQMRKFK